MLTTRCRILGPLGVVCLCCSALPAGAVELGVREAQFTLDGRPTFLLGISYYGALGAPPESIARDLDDIQRLGLNWLRVWATWSAFDNDVSAVDCDGRPREPFLTRLKELVAECDRRGLVVDVTLSRGNGATGPPRLQTLTAHRRAVETLVVALRSRRNWYLDLGNERNIRDQRSVGYDELKQLRDAAKALDQKLLITASFAGELERGDVKSCLETVGVDFLSPHRPRHAKSAQETEARTRQYMAWAKELGRIVPIHYQEPFRRGFTRGWEPSAEDFLADARGALRGGAAGWCFHNGSQGGAPEDHPRRSFDLRRQRLFDQLDAVELEALKGLRAEDGHGSRR